MEEARESVSLFLNSSTGASLHVNSSSETGNEDDGCGASKDAESWEEDNGFSDTTVGTLAVDTDGASLFSFVGNTSGNRFSEEADSVSKEATILSEELSKGATGSASFVSSDLVTLGSGGLGNSNEADRFNFGVEEDNDG